MKNNYKILVLNLPGLVLKSGSRWYNKTKKGSATLRYFPYPWFMGYLTSLLKKNQFDSYLLDAVAMEWSSAKTLKFIETYKPTHIVCEPTWASTKEDMSFLSKINKDIVKIAVGNYATNFPKECLLKTKVNHVVIGEYEFSILNFLKSNCKNLPINFYNRKKTTYSYPELVNLDLFPYPERNDTPINYWNEPSCFGKNIVMVSSRGCRLKCNFCNVECVYGKHVYRTRTPKNVVDEMEFLKKNYDFDEIYFDDDNMVAKKEHIEEICNEIIKRNLSIKWLCMGDGLIENSTLKLLKKAGCVTYKFGLEHLDKEVLQAIPKPLNKNKSLDLIEKCKKIGIKSYVNLMIGLPKSSKIKDTETLNEVISKGPDLIQISIAIPYPGTLFFRQAKENKWLKSTDPNYFDATGASPISYPNYSDEEITKVFKYGWNRWYKYVLFNKPTTLFFFTFSEFRRNGFLITIKKILSYFKKLL